MQKMWAVLIAMVLAAGLAACSSPTAPDTPSGQIIVMSPQEGQIFKRGDKVTISWRCQGDCQNFQKKSVEIFYRRVDSQYYEKIDEHFLSGSIAWTIGWVTGGLYEIRIVTPTVWTSPTGGYIEASGKSGLFKIE